MLLNLPADYPEELTTHYTSIEDDEFMVRASLQYDANEFVKLRYVLVRFDVGHMSGGIQSMMQSHGMQAAKKRQLEERCSLMRDMPDMFEWTRSAQTGRLSGARIRMSQKAVSTANMPCVGQEIEEAMRGGGVSMHRTYMHPRLFSMVHYRKEGKLPVITAGEITYQ